MKSKVLGIILLVINVILIIVGVTCAIIGLVLNSNAQLYQAPIVNALFSIGFVGVGSAISTLFVILGFALAVSD